MSGPRSLKALLAGWNPKGAGAASAPTVDQASAAFALAWEPAVGAEIARRSRPAKFSNGVLTVLTASGAWSDELSLLAPRIIDALQSAFPDSKLRRLRFVVATGRTRLLLDGERFRGRSGAGPKPQALAPPRARNDASDSTDVSAAVARLAALQKALDDERDRAGWRICMSCRRRFLPDSLAGAQCAPCAENSRRHAAAQIERALMQAPWLRAHDIARTFPRITSSGYERTRQRLLTRWQLDITAAERRLRRGAPSAEDRVVAWSYLMLLTGLPQRDIGRAVVIDALGQNWAGVLFGSERTPKEEARRPLREKHK